MSKTEPSEQSRERKRSETQDESRPGREPRGVQQDIADADKKARTGSRKEPVRNTPPAGDWNDTFPR